MIKLILFSGLVCIGMTLYQQAAKAEGVRKPLPSPEEIAKLPKDGGDEFNGLVHANSPYLLQHARNPVAWHEWGEEAFAEAKKRDLPIFLSVGYSSCHWCHVMEHESFEDKEVAKYLNEHFVCIKVDREERPDIDQIYMTATQLFTRRGGWPNSVWLTPDGRAWFAGTYYPKPQFMQLLAGLDAAWNKKRGEVEEQATSLSDAIKKASSQPVGGKAKELKDTYIDRAIQTAQQSFDAVQGGFGGAPKFPPHAKLRMLLTRYQQTKDAALLEMITKTLDAMALGGIHDHVGGGFHRYATDDRWFLPHFEKMLYDNGQLAWVYAEAYAITKKPLYQETLRGICDWVLRDMTAPGGGFYAALDADSEGEEGKFYVWKRTEVEAILGKEAAASFCKVYQVSEAGNYFEEASRKATGANIPYLSATLDAAAAEAKQEVAVFKKDMAEAREKLRKVREKRIWPGLDDKVLTSWNGLMISGLAKAGASLNEPRYTAAAEKAADFVLGNMRDGERLYRSYRGSKATLKGYLDDYAFFSEGLLDLHETTGDAKWLKSVEALSVVLDEFYRDGETGPYYFTAHDHEVLLTRTMEPFDNATPAGNAVVVRIKARLAKVTKKAGAREDAEIALKNLIGFSEVSPYGSSTLVDAFLHFKALPEVSGSTTASASSDTEEAPDAKASGQKVDLKLFMPAKAGKPGTTVKATFKVHIGKGYHINSDKPLKDFLIPTRVFMDKNSDFRVLKVTYPKADVVKFGPDDMAVFEHDVEFEALIQVQPKAKAGKKDLVLKVDTQACDDKTCLAPETHELKVSFEVE